MKRKILVDLTQEPDGTITDTSVNTAWSIQDEAIMRGNNYADHIEEQLTALREDGATLHALLKNAFTDGFLYGFAHKFDDTNYEGDK
jgi:hypothetical protein